MSLVFLAGLLSIVVQVILLRELSAAFYGVDLVYLLALGAWLLWTAAGAMLARRTLQPSAARVAAVLVALGFAIPLDVAFVRRLRLVLGGTPGAYLPLPVQVASSMLCLLVPSVLLGLLFQWSAKRYLRDSRPGLNSEVRPGLVSGADSSPDLERGRRTLARAYAIESAGGVAAGLLTTWTLQWAVQNLQLALATAVLAFAAAAATGSGGIFRKKYLPTPFGGLILRGMAFAGLIACLAAGLNASRLDLWMTSWNHPDVVETADSPYGRLTIAKRAGQVTVYENDALALESEGTDAEDFAHLAMLQHPRPRRVLLVSGAANGLVPAVAQHGAERIDDVDLNGRLVDLLRRHLPASFDASLSRPQVRVRFDDPRRAIRGCGTQVRPSTGTGRSDLQPCNEAYDVIIVAAAEPASAQANRFFTREFFDQCASRLAPGGLIALRLTSIENLWTTPVISRTATIYAALRSVFADVVVLPGTTNIVLASRAPLSRDWEVLAGRLADRGIRARMITPRYVRYLYSNDRYAEIEALLRRHPSQPNTDANARSYRATALFWLSKFVPSIAQADLTAVADAFAWSRVRAWLLLAVLCAMAIAWRLAGWSRRNAIVAAAGFGGMTLETLLLVHYQLKHGVMYQDLGLLLMSVMAGLAAGAWATDWWSRTRHAHYCTATRLLLAALVVVALACSAAIRTGYGSGSFAIALLLVATGALVAAVFAFASLRDDVDPRRLVSPLYAADVLGGSVGSLVASVLMIPLLGLPLTAEWTATLMAIAVILV